jgi:hypothetical protein
MTNLAYDIALSIRTAQTYGISAKGTINNASFSTPYGISFTNGATSYILFADTNASRVYDATDVPTTYNLHGAYKITSLCTLSGVTETCNRTRIDITFVRPNPDAKIVLDTNTPWTDAVEIKLGSTADASALKTITVRTTGQISVQ